MKTSLTSKRNTIDNLRGILKIKFLFLTLLFSISGVCNLQAQDNRISAGDDLWPTIETQLGQQKSDTAFYFIIQFVRDHCDEDVDCLFDSYETIRDYVEVKFNLPAAIYISQEIGKIARREKDLEKEGRSYMNLRRFYGAMQNEELEATNREKAQRIFEEIGNEYLVAILRMSKLENSLRYRDYEEVLPEMNALLEEVKEIEDERIAIYIHHRLINLSLLAGHYDEVETHLAAVENSEISNPVKFKESGFGITIALARGDIAKSKNNLVEAEAYYRKALQISEEDGSRWLEISTLHLLAELEWKRGNVSLTKSYLNRAKTKAEELRLDEFLLENYAFQAKIAEKEGRYADALFNTKQEYFYSEKIREQNAGFQLRNYHLQLETEQLKTEKKEQEYELTLQENQLTNLLVIIGFGLLLTGLLIFGMYMQRKRKKELAAQNALIQKQAERLANLDIAKSRFFANVSHELRTPLSLIIGPISSALKSETLDERNSSYLKMAHRSAKDLLKLVGSILDLSKLESGKLKLEEQAETFYPLIRRIASTFESFAQQSGIEFTFLYKSEKDLKLQLDRKKIETIINNLLSNAIKFTPVGGKIFLTVEDLASKIRLTVTDTGRGIHPNDLLRIFDRFYQSEQADTATEGGTGIGLSLCQNLIKLMDGEIGVKSKLGEGSTFYIEFPRKEVLGTRDTIENEELIQEEDFNLIAAPNNLEVELPIILVVEDNRSLQEYLDSLLSPFYKVVTAENGQKALEKLEDTSFVPALILSDVMMPVMDGFQFLKELKTKDSFSHFPIIMLTARADIQDKLKALRIGVDDYLLKPFEEEELLVRIKNLLDNQGRRKEVIRKDKPQKNTLKIREKDKAWLEAFETYVKENLTSHLMTVPSLARHFAMSESSLLRQLKGLTGLTPVKYLQEIRLAKARILLENQTYDSIARVAKEVGYSDARTFSRSYKKRFGKLPSESLQLQ